MSKLTSAEFVQKSLELNIFFLRIMKEHSFFIEAAFVPKNSDLALRADRFRRRFDMLLREAVSLANFNVSSRVLNSGEVVTDKTLRAEKKTARLSGIKFDIALTEREILLKPGKGHSALESKVFILNSRAIVLTKSLVRFKTLILNEMLAGRLYTFNYPLLIEHIRREARFFIQHLERLQNKMALDPSKEIMEEKVFWDRIMSEHSLFIAHLLDPTEVSLIKQANVFAREFRNLEKRAIEIKRTGNQGKMMRVLISDEINSTIAIRAFKNTGDELILMNKIRSIIIPLLADHVLREANHFLRILKGFPRATK